MKNHIVSILIFLSLIFGLTLIPVKDCHRFQLNIESGAILMAQNGNIQKSEKEIVNQEKCYFSSTTIEQTSGQSNSLFTDIADHLKAFNCILVSSVYQANVVYSKSFKFSAGSYAAILKMTFHNKLSDKKNADCCSLNFNYIKYSSKYNVYALAHILI